MWPTWQGLRPLPAAKRATGYPATELHKVPHLERPTHLTAIPRHRQVVLTTGQACEAATKPSQLPEAIHCDARTVSPPAASPGLCACAQRPPKAVGVISTCWRCLQHPPISHPGPGSHRAQTRSVRCSINRRWQGVYPIGQITGQRLPPPPYGRTASAVILSPPFTPQTRAVQSPRLSTIRHGEERVLSVTAGCHQPFCIGTKGELQDGIAVGPDIERLRDRSSNSQTRTVPPHSVQPRRRSPCRRKLPRRNLPG